MKKIKLNDDLVQVISLCECPACKKRLDGRTQIGTEHELSVFHEGTHAIPKPGDVSVCMYCKSKLVFMDGGDGFLRVRLMTPEEIRDLPEVVAQALNLPLDKMVEMLTHAMDRKTQREDDTFLKKWLG